jgi:hypothetical protein
MLWNYIEVVIQKSNERAMPILTEDFTVFLSLSNQMLGYY